MPSNLNDEEIQNLALASERVKELLDEQEPKRVIVRPPALINIVVWKAFKSAFLLWTKKVL